jgi:hypothetical protein
MKKTVNARTKMAFITKKNTHKIVGNGGLTGTVVDQGQLANHLVGVLGSVLHSSTLGRHFRGITLHKRARVNQLTSNPPANIHPTMYLRNTPVERVGEGELLEVLQDVVIDLVGAELGCRFRVSRFPEISQLTINN